jgi:hypothetical protein
VSELSPIKIRRKRRLNCLHEASRDAFESRDASARGVSVHDRLEAATLPLRYGVAQLGHHLVGDDLHEDSIVPWQPNRSRVSNVINCGPSARRTFRAQAITSSSTHPALTPPTD